jgi:hypothetical protein
MHPLPDFRIIKTFTADFFTDSESQPEAEFLDLIGTKSSEGL